MNKQSKKNQRNRAFLAAIAMLLVSAIVITTASFAWFTLGKNVAVNELDLKVTAKEGISISANSDAALDTWTNVLTFEDLDATSTTKWVAPSSTTNNFPAVINPASSSFAAGSLPAFFEGGIDANASGALTMVAEASVAENHTADADKPGYYAFDIYINYPGSSSSIKVNVGESVINVKTDTDGTVANSDVEQSMRIGFANFQTGSTVAETLVYNGKDADISSTNPVTGAGESADLGKDVYNVSAAAKGTLSLGSGYSATATTNQAANAMLTLNGGINHIRVYIWMEGQDAKCTDEMFSQLVGAQLVFKMV